MDIWNFKKWIWLERVRNVEITKGDKINGEIKSFAGYKKIFKQFTISGKIMLTFISQKMSLNFKSLKFELKKYGKWTKSQWERSLGEGGFFDFQQRLGK
jgi:hypothetical protein